ncbi:glycogen synthase GlgA [Collinsella sp. AF08-23]|uniref:glycogen synthase GlgA n=1 Tax=Collinsella sp. AF08-23 TaxID=2292211 RepID=UPI000E49F884|nr:glycogen synthase GlgA [Collinsella sp. AF08-23]RHS39799.1 glycogen synthase GlgA [Collinsella sp. AF08-23]
MSDTTPSKLHIAFASAEAAPFVKTGGLGDVAGSLPHALKAAGADVVVFVPRYDTIAQEYKDRMEHLCDFYVPLGWRNEYCGLERLNHEGVDYLFVDNERYFSRGYPYGFFDDGERFAYFSKAIVEALQYLPHTLDNFTCDVLHCNDWHTAMAPVFLREFYQALPLYQNVKTVFSIHNIAFQGQYSAKVLNDILGLAHIPAAAFQLTCGPDAVNYMQGALNYTDAITTVSPTYAEEIKTPDFGEHLDGILRRRAPILQGIVNGIDTTAFDPTTDPRIAANYSVQDRAGKAECKARLQQELGLEVRDDRPLMVMVTRLTRQKGMDLVTYALDRILSGGVQVAVLGTGDTEYENALRYFEGKYPGTMAVRIQFDPALSQRMYAGADLFLMPSLFEPCGLSQMIAMRYGTLPIVRETGGLKDTVIPYNQYTGEGTGFSFTHFNGDEMADAVFRAAHLFWDNRDAFNGLVENAMKADFSWKRSADAYITLYHNLHPEIPMPQPQSEVVEKPKQELSPAVETDAEPKTEVKKESAEKPAPAKKATTRKAAAKPAASKTAATKSTATKKTTTTKAAAAKASAAAKTTTPAKAPATKTPTAKATAAAKTTANTKTAETKAPVAKATAAKTAKTRAATPKTASTKAAAAKPATSKASATTSAAPKVTATKTAAKSAAAAPAAKPATTTSAAAATVTKATTAKPATTTAATKPAAAATTAKPASQPTMKTVPKATRRGSKK